MLTLEQAIERKTQEFKRLTDQLEAAKVFIQDKIAEVKKTETDLILLNTAMKMLESVPPENTKGSAD